MLKLEKLNKTFNAGTIDECKLFNDFTLHIDKGEFVSVIGSNGSGKTTMLNIICGSMPIDSGSIIFDGKDITKLSEYKRAKYMGRVFQSPGMGTCPNLTILENMSLADNKNKPYGLSRGVNKKRVDYYRSLVEECGIGLENRMNVPVGSLSGGQRQALALVIANMADIEFLVLDEHTAALDPKSSQLVMQLTDKFVKKSNITTLMVTHNLRFAVEYGNRLIMMHEGNCIVDIKDDDKKNCDVDDLLRKFNEISIEKGN